MQHVSGRLKCVKCLMMDQFGICRHQWDAKGFLDIYFALIMSLKSNTMYVLARVVQSQ